MVAPRLHRARRGGPCPARNETKSPAPDDPTFVGLQGGGLLETERGAEVGDSPEYEAFASGRGRALVKAGSELGSRLGAQSLGTDRDTRGRA